MNDFTKAELRLMIMLITELILDSTQPPCVHELREKLESVHNNWCDHEWDELLSCVQCKKCKIREYFNE